jgi:hypothetical protein
MVQTTRLQLPLIAAAQAQKHVTHNEAVMRLDGLVQMTAKSYTTSAQPGSPADGDLYLLPAGKTGTDWGGYANHGVAHYYDGVWHQYFPKTGWLSWAQDTSVLYYYTGSLWGAVPLPNAIGDGTAGAPSLAFAADADSGLYRIGANNPGIAAGGALVLSLSSAGNTQPLQPAFSAVSAAQQTDVTGDATGPVTIICGTESYDQGANHNAATGIFTAQVAGRYRFQGGIYLGGLTTSHIVEFTLVTTGRTYYFYYGVAADVTGGELIRTGSCECNLAAGDTAKLQVKVSGGAKTVDIKTAYTFFSGGLAA